MVARERTLSTTLSLELDQPPACLVFELGRGARDRVFARALDLRKAAIKSGNQLRQLAGRPPLLRASGGLTYGALTGHGNAAGVLTV